MEWTREETLRFITLYKKHELLWNPKHYLHFNKASKRDAWDTISKQTNRSADECRRKLDTLMASFRRENMKIRRSVRMSRGVHVYTSSWYAYDTMKFILRKRNPHQVLEKPVGVRNEEQIENQILCTKEDTTSQQVSSSHVLQKNLLNLSMEDESQLFGNLVATKLRNYDKLTQSMIQNEIMGIFLNADRNLHSQQACVTPSASNHLSSTTYQQQTSQNCDIDPLTIDSSNQQAISASTLDYYSASSTSHTFQDNTASPVHSGSSHEECEIERKL